MLILPIKKQWFDMIAKGEKEEEYRSLTPYYKVRFQNIGLLDIDGCANGKTAVIGLRNGYSRKDPTLVVSVMIDFGLGKKEWGASSFEVYYILKIVKHHTILKDGEIFYRYKDGE